MQNVVILKKLTCKAVTRLCVRCLSVPGPELHTFPPLHNEYVYTVFLFTKGRGGEKLKEREC
jgi:hypothetical protein